VRDIIVTLLIVGALPLILWRPWIGILVWSWVGYMNPHRLAWGFAYNMPFAMMIGATLLLSMLMAMMFRNEKYRIPWSGTIALWLIYIAWMYVTTLMAIYPERAWGSFDKVIKIQVMTLITIMLIKDAYKIRALIWVIVGSIAYYSVKGGLFTLLTGGAFRVLGPGASDIADNNSLALATLMVVPLMCYLYAIYHQQRWLRWLLGISILLSIVSAFGSQSRGALVAMIAVAGFFWLKSSSKVITGTGIVILAVLTFSFMPDSWHERMGTIATYEEDASAMGRIHAWEYAINIASDRLTGGGFNSWSPETYAIYSPEQRLSVVAHSIYFSVMADHGWPGLIMFLTLLFIAWRNLSRVIADASDSNSEYKPVFLAKMLQVSLIAYMSGGAFLSLAYFDLPWHIIALSILLSHIYTKELAGKTSGLRHYASASPVRHGQE
jgi:putative inorganic carbon (hco3(-)) transporter